MATTPTHDWPTPDNVDRVADGASAIRALGDAIDADVPLFYATTGDVGSVAPTAAEDVVVTFPASYFTATPVVVANPIGAFPTGIITISALSSSGCTVTIKNTNTVTTIVGTFGLLAIQT